MSPASLSLGARGFGSDERPREEVDKWYDDQRHSGETLAENTSDACAERGVSWNVTWSSQEQTLGVQSMMTDLVMSGQVRVWTDSNAAQATRRGFGKTCPNLDE